MHTTTRCGARATVAAAFSAALLLASGLAFGAGQPQFFLMAPDSALPDAGASAGAMEPSVSISDQTTVAASSSRDGQYAVLVDANGAELAGVNFDIRLPDGLGRDGVSIVDCGGAAVETHIARCEFVEGGAIRVLIFSVPTTPLPPSFEGIRIEVSGLGGDRIALPRDSVAASSLDGTVVQSAVHTIQ